MKAWALWTLVRRDLVRERGALVTSGFGIAAGTAALVFFLSLGIGVRSVLLGDVFPIDQVELEPPKSSDPGLLGMLFASGASATITPKQVQTLRALDDVQAAYPKLRFSFPCSAYGGKELLGRQVGTGELIGDGIDPQLLGEEDTFGDHPFVDPLKHPFGPCRSTNDCKAKQYCEPVEGQSGQCVEPVPILVSRYLVEIFDKSLAPAHGLPPVGQTLVKRAGGIVFEMKVGESLLGRSKRGKPRTIHARVVGVSDRAIDLGVTLPLEVVKRLNKQYSGAEASTNASSVVVKVADASAVSDVVAAGKRFGLTPRDTRARDVSVLMTGLMALLALVAGTILLVSASNIAYTFRVLVTERRREIALYRAVGASAFDMMKWLVSLALSMGLVGGAVGIGLAFAASLAADHLAATRLPDFPFKPESFFQFPAWLIASAIGFAALFALLGALGPARRAGRIEPVTALAALD